ncbi:hypothetical protein [Nocardia sp. BMG51109]|uniref:hypothetical protein n=1 Tax=Nocardia sp. BMG51109 TaxID=1056816 RepID=UPI0004B37AD2|nr:hypothetical protein [Nocardia sp. BMG51109]
MKALAHTLASTVTVSTVTMLAALPLAAGAAHAEPETTPTCMVPADPTGQMLVLWGNAAAVPAGVRGDNLTLVRFTGPAAYRYSVVGVSGWREATYAREDPAPGVAVFNSTEHTTPEPTDFTITLTCRTDTTGNYRYTTPAMPEPVDSDAPTVYRFAPLAN